MDATNSSFLNDTPNDYGAGDMTPFPPPLPQQRLGQPPPEIRIPNRGLASFSPGLHHIKDSDRPLDYFATRAVQNRASESNCEVGPQKERLIGGVGISQVSGPLPISTIQPSTHRPFNDKPMPGLHSPTPRVQAPIWARRLARVGQFLGASQTKVLNDTTLPFLAAQSVHDEVTNSDDEMAYQYEDAWDWEHAGIVHTNEFSEFPFWQKSHTPSSGLQSPIFERRTFFHHVHDRIAETGHEMQQEDRLYETVQSQEFSEYPFPNVLPTRLSDAAHPSDSVLSPHSTAQIRIPGFEGEMAPNSRDPSSFKPAFSIRPVQDMATAGDNNDVIPDPSKVEFLEDVRRNQETTLLDPMVNVSDFVKKLFNSLEDPNLQSVICWGPLGDCFWIMNVNDFTNTILPRLYKHSNFASFVRQLNKYGFHKMKNTGDDKVGIQPWCFRHANFHALKPEELEQIKPRHAVTQRNVRKRESSSSGSSSSFPSSLNESSMPPLNRRFSSSSRDSGGPYIQSSRSESSSRMEIYLDIEGLRRESDDAKARLRSLDRTSERLRLKIEDAQMQLDEHNDMLRKVMAHCGMMPPL